MYICLIVYCAHNYSISIFYGKQNLKAAIQNVRTVLFPAFIDDMPPCTADKEWIGSLSMGVWCMNKLAI